MSVYSKITSMLELPSLYSLFIRLVGTNKGSIIYVNEHIRPYSGAKILDIGCGTANILNFLPDVKYVGFDMNPKYIEYAKKKHGDKANFFCDKLSEDISIDHTGFDIILATGVLHHLNDNEAIELFKLAKNFLTKDGRLITLDGCYTNNQSKLIKLILSSDRGKFVRFKEEYLALARDQFDNINVIIRSDILTIPYTHIIMECTL